MGLIYPWPIYRGPTLGLPTAKLNDNFALVIIPKS
jgi:hypothetical protein